MSQKILKIEDFKKLKVLLQGSEENAKLVANIVDNCDVVKSLPIILALIPQSNNKFWRLTSTIGMSKNALMYMAILHTDILPLTYSLDWLLHTYDLHCKEEKIEKTSSEYKVLKNLIITNYVQPDGEKSTMYDFKPIPKKK